MSPSKPIVAAQAPLALSLHTSEAAREFDTNHLAWVDFDQHLSVEIAQLEKQFERYLTPMAQRKKLGR